MSIAHLQSIVALRPARELLPENLPIDVLISLARELAFLDEGKLEHAEIRQLRACMRELIERLLSMQSERRLGRFRENEDVLLPELVTELNKNIRNELVNRLIENHSTREGMEDAFADHFRE